MILQLIYTKKMGFKFYDKYSKFESNYVYFMDNELQNQFEGLPMIDIDE